MQAPKHCHFSWAGMSAIWLCLGPICHSPSFFFCYFFPPSLSSAVFFWGGVTLLSRTGVWLTEWLSWMQEERVHVVNSWETPGRKIESLIALIPLLLSPDVDATPVFQSKCYFASDGGKIIPAGWYQEVNLWKIEQALSTRLSFW